MDKLFKAVTNNDVEEVKKLLAGEYHHNPLMAEEKIDSLFQAARHGYSEIIELLINDGVPVNVHHYCNETPLCFAARFGHISAV